MVAERPRKKQKKKNCDIWTARQVNHDSMGWFCCYRSSILFNYNNYPCTGFLINLNCSRFFLKICVYIWFFECQLFLVSVYLGLVIHHFWWREYFSRTPGSYRYTNSIELVPRLGLWPSDCESWRGYRYSLLETVQEAVPIAANRNQWWSQ